LDLATVDAGIMELDIGEVDLGSLFADVAQMTKDRFAEGHIKLKVSTSLEASAFKADVQRLRQIIGNLLSNAANHAPEGSTVTLSSRRDGSDILITVHDDGPGIPKDVLASVFERFVAHANGGRRGGTGLGLSIVKGLVELHRGTVAINSKPGEGTSVICRFPSDPTHFQVAAE
jgi:signal transduction histidine kinase